MTGWAPYLDPGERILWQGRPTGRLFVFHLTDIFMVPFSIAWFAFVLVAIALGGMSGLGLLILPLFFCAGLHGVIGRFVWDMAVRRATLYAISDRRAFPSRTLDEKPILPGTGLSLKPGRLGDLVFGPKDMLTPRGVSFTGSFAFRATPGAEDAYAVARAVRRGDPPT